MAAVAAIVARLSQAPPSSQLILTCRPVAIDGAIVSLGFPEEQAFLRDVAERKPADIEAGVAEVIGHDVSIRCVVANVEVAPLTGATERAPARRGATDLRRGSRRRRRGVGPDRIRPGHDHRADLSERPHQEEVDGDGQPAADGPADAAGDAAGPG